MPEQAAKNLTQSSTPARARESFARRDADGQRLYMLLALFDTRDGTYDAYLVQAAREGWERSHPDMAEATAWDEFDRLWARRDERV